MNITSNVIAPLTGRTFLQNGLSCSGQDRNNTFEDVTTFSEHYQYHLDSQGRRKQFEPPKPASVIHKNDCYMELEDSLTQDTYQPPVSTTSKAGSSRSSRAGCMNKTNFHMSADKRLETVHTTNQVGFALLASDRLWNKNQFAHYKDVNAGPLGKRVIDPSIQSEYNNAYSGADEDVGGVKCAGMRQHGAAKARNPLTGRQLADDGGKSHTTTHCDTYRGEPLSISNSPTNAARLQQLRITSIPEGDRSKAPKPLSNSQLSYSSPPSLSNHTYNKSQAVKNILGASIHLNDHTKSPKEYFSTTATDTYRQHLNTGKEVPVVKFGRNASFLPRGDLDPSRVTRRITHSTTKKAHGQPPSNSFPAHVDSSGWRTQSHFDIGNHADSDDHTPISSTMASSYLPVSQKTERVRAPPFDNLPLHYFPSHLSKSTTAASYPEYPVRSRLEQINKPALENLKCSHWSLPKMTDKPSYLTTNRKCFTTPISAKEQLA